MNRTLIITHGRCVDGFGAAWAAWKKFGHSARYHFANHGEDPPFSLIDESVNVFILDFSYSRERLGEIAESSASLLVLDHHVSAQTQCGDLPFCTFDMNRSGAGMAWDHFFPLHQYIPWKNRRPWLINYIEDRDLWRFKLPNSRVINAAIDSTPKSFLSFDELNRRGLRAALREGEPITRYFKQYVEEVTESSTSYVDIVLPDGSKYTQIPVVNCPYKGVSEIVNGLLSSKAPFAVGWYRSGTGLFKYSLRSRGAFDVSRIAQLYGGGGHKNAAGFSSEKLLFV